MSQNRNSGITSPPPVLTATSVAINDDIYSLNSLNGFVTLADGQAFFFKFHQEEGEGDTVAEYYKIKVSEMYSKKRSRTIARPRQIAMALAKELTPLSLPDIGEAFGGRDHTTVIHATSKIARLIREDRSVYNLVQELTARVKQVR